MRARPYALRFTPQEFERIAEIAVKGRGSVIFRNVF
jgi:hypothetical protein